MDLATIIGMIFAFGVVVYAIILGGDPGLFWDVPSALIVLGGTLGATFINYPIEKVLMVVKVTKNAFFSKIAKPEALIPVLVDMSNKARREGVLALQSAVKQLDDKFMESGFQLIIDGQEAAVTEAVLGTEISNIEERHKLGAEILMTISVLAPAFGMIGTLIGLVQMLATMSDPSTIGSSMAVAIITTFYGAFIANVFCIPLAGKLKTRSKEELLVKGLIAEAILSIQAGDNPRVVEQKLLSFIAPAKRVSSFDGKK